MTPEQLKRYQESLGISSLCLARMTGKDKSTVWRWTSGEIGVPVYVGTLMFLLTQVRSACDAADFTTVIAKTTQLHDANNHTPIDC